MISRAAFAASWNHIRIVASSAVYPFATVAAEQSDKTTRDKTLKIESTGSSGGRAHGHDQRLPSDQEVREDCNMNSNVKGLWKHVVKLTALALIAGLVLVGCNGDDDNNGDGNGNGANVAFNVAVVDGLVTGGMVYVLRAADFNTILNDDAADLAALAIGEGAPANGLATIDIPEGDVTFPLAFIFDSDGANDGDANVLDMFTIVFATPGADERIVMTPQASVVVSIALALAGGDATAVSAQDAADASDQLPQVLRSGLDVSFLDGVAPADADLTVIVASAEAVAAVFFAVIVDLSLDGARDAFLTCGADIANDGVLDGVTAQGVDFGVDPLQAAQVVFASDLENGGDFRNPTQSPEDIVQIAGGLNLAFLTRNAANHWDMMSFWPLGDNPTHLVGCIETGRALISEADGRYNPSVQTIAITGDNKGEVRTVLRGMDRCDGIRTTPWGTILATEETGDGSAYEILDPLAVTDVFIEDRGAAGEVADIREASGAAHDGSQVVKRVELPTMAWEGLLITEQGVVIAGDELRPGTAADDVDGGALFKFIPASLRTPGAAPIDTLAASPLVAGNSYAFQASCRDDRQQFGQGCEIGNGVWVPVNADTARASANDAGATGFYRPEDLHADPTFTPPEGSPNAIRFCVANTGNRGASNYAEVICSIDLDPATVAEGGEPILTTTINRLLEGDSQFNAHDNLAFNPLDGNLYVIEDSGPGDIFACLPDGADRDIKSDGCVRFLRHLDPSAEPTGFLFHPNGLTAYVCIQHSGDNHMPLADNFVTDDLIEITNFFVAGGRDFGDETQTALENDAQSLFGFGAPVAQTSAGDAVRMPTNTEGDLIEVAGGLTATFLTRDAANHLDMMSFWPLGDNPTHLIGCIETGRAQIGDGDERFNPSVQRISLTDGSVETILRGMDRCDGIRTTPWGTVLATEETGDGSAYEILSPMTVTDFFIADRGAAGEVADIREANGAAHDGSQVVKRPALPTMAWEGLAVLDSGVIYAGDELRPGSYEADPGVNGTRPINDTDGGAIFKFIPADPRPDGGLITALNQSPLANGATYAFQASCRDDRPQFGQGCEIGNGVWVPVDADTARASANAAGATGYYRPEDLHLDPTYSGDGVRFCFANTGNTGAGNHSEVICAVDSDPLSVVDAENNPALTTVFNRFVEGDGDFAAADNLAFQPHSGILYVIEDRGPGDVWACLPDGADRDIKTDGCVRIMSLTDGSTEPTGFLFHPNGQVAYVASQHSNDDNMPLVDNFVTDDLFVITGFANPVNLPGSDFGASREAILQTGADAEALFGFGAPLPQQAD